MMKKTLTSSAFYGLIALLVFVWLLPMLFIFLTSLKTNTDFYNNPSFSMPTSIAWENFARAFIRGRLSVYMKNGLIVSSLTVPVGVITASMAGFALTRFRSKYNKPIFIYILIGMMIPMQTLLIPINFIYNRIGLTNSHLGLIILYVGIHFPFSVLVMRGFMKSIPLEIDEAARIDGCNSRSLYWRVIMPNAWPAISTLCILNFLSSWNEFMFCSILCTDDKMRTVPAGIITFMGETVIDYTTLCAGVLITVAPLLIVYLIFQRYFVEGMGGAVKG